MRVVRMNPRSRYHGMPCMHCHRKVATGRVALCSTYFLLVDPAKSRSVYLTTQSKKRWLTKKGFTIVEGFMELQVRVVYHRACLEKILTGSAEDPEKVASRFEVYRGELAEEYEELPPWLRL